MYYNFYTPFLENEKITIIPNIKYEIKSSDKTYVWNKEVDRMDTISNKFYGHPYGGRLIMLANSGLGTNEDDIPNESTLNIPYPYKDGIQRWIDAVEKFKKYY